MTFSSLLRVSLHLFAMTFGQHIAVLLFSGFILDNLLLKKSYVLFSWLPEPKTTLKKGAASVLF